MTIEYAKKMWPVLKAYSEGKKIEVKTTNGRWVETESPCFLGKKFCYRVKEEPNYRPFKGEKECMEEMKRHEPFGWIKNGKDLCVITSIQDGVVFGDFEPDGYDTIFDEYTFLDGTPFGKAVENEGRVEDEEAINQVKEILDMP